MIPIPMVLHCPMCCTQHVDAPEPEKGWENPPHRSHLCHLCGWIWRPADVATVGVEAIETRGANDSAPTGPRRYFVHDGEQYDASYTDPAAARREAKRALDFWRGIALEEDGWDDEVESVAWGVLVECAVARKHAGSVGEDGLDDDGVDYLLGRTDAR